MNFDPFSNGVTVVLLGVLAVLILATVIPLYLAKLKPERDFSEFNRRTRSWWVMASVFTISILINRTISLAFLAFLCYLAFKEYLTLIPTNHKHRRMLFWAYLSIPVQFFWVYTQSYSMFITFIPVFVFLFLPMRMILTGENKGFLHSLASTQWGLMLIVFGLSHMAYLLTLSDHYNPVAGGTGSILYLVILTQCNDVAQYICGSLFGRHKVIPKVSPNKTWEGLFCGFATTIGLAFLLAPLLTPLTHFHTLLAGLLIAVTGFVGDVSISALKRDLGIKDFSGAIPGHGGVLDRVDSLTFTAPLFFHFVRYLH